MFRADKYGSAENPNYEFIPVDEHDADFRLIVGTYDDVIESMWTATIEAA